MREWLDFLIPLEADFLEVAGRRIPLVLVRHPRARRYLLRLRSDGAARVTIPRGGSLAEGKRFAARNLAWMEEQLRRLQFVDPAYGALCRTSVHPQPPSTRTRPR